MGYENSSLMSSILIHIKIFRGGQSIFFAPLNSSGASAGLIQELILAALCVSP